MHRPDLSMHATRSSGARSTSFGAVGAFTESIARMDCASVLESDTLSAEMERAHGGAAVSAAPALEDGVRVGWLRRWPRQLERRPGCCRIAPCYCGAVVQEVAHMKRL